MKFDARTLSTTLLQMRCVAARTNLPGAVSVVVIILGVLCCALWVPYLNSELDHTRDAVNLIAKLNRTTPVSNAAPPSPNELHQSQFYAALGEQGYAEQQLKTLFDIAAKNGLRLDQGEYKSNFDRNSDTLAYQIQLPVVGSYSAIRQFCEEVLLAIPFASLDEMSFKRDAISNNNLEAKLRFTLYLTNHQQIATAQP